MSISAPEFLKWAIAFNLFNNQGGAGSGGTVTSVGSGTGLTGGTITTVGSLSFAPIAANSVWANNTGSPAVPQVISYATLRAALGFGTMSLQDASSVAITGGTAVLSRMQAPFRYAPIATNTNLAVSDSFTLFYANGLTGDITLTDPVGLASYPDGMIIGIKNISSFNVTFTPFSGQTIDGQTNFVLKPGNGVYIQKSTSNWLVISAYMPNTSVSTILIPGVFAASTANLTGYTYNNGSAGVGATLTAPGNGTFSTDGFGVPVGQRFFYKDDATGSGAWNGVYTVTVSSSSNPAVLTRATDYNSSINMLRQRVINVQNGLTNGGSVYMQTSTINTVGTDPVTYSLQFAVSQYLQTTGGTMAGAINMNSAFQVSNLPTPVLSGDATNKSYVDGRTAGGIPFIPGVFAASTANLTGYTYNNGTAGIGATLTAPANGTFSADGFAVPVGQRFFYKDDSTGGGAWNGVYTVTVSSTGAPAVLTRATDYNSSVNMLRNRVLNVLNGLNNGGSVYMQTSVINTVGTDPVTYSLLFAVSQYAQITQPTIANRIPSYNNTTGLLQTAGATTSTALTLVNPLSITLSPNNVTGLTINGVSSGFNTSARMDIINGTAGQTRALLALGGGSSSCQFVYDTVNAPAGLSLFMSTAGTQVTTWDTTGNFNMSISGTTPKLILGSTGSASTGAFTWDGINVFPYFGSRALITQNGVANVGAYAQWDGAGSLISGGIPGQLLAVKVLTSTTSASYVQTAGTRNITIYAQGAGGGGGGGTTAVSCGSGGSAGALAIWSGPVNTFTYQCGIGGAGGVGSGSGIGSGGTSTTITAFAPGNITAQGGFGGNPGTVAPGFATISSTIATATGGQTNIPGQRGRYGMLYSSTFVYGGDGGNSFFGPGGQGQIVTTANTFSSGSAGSNYGAGGGGGAIIPTGSAPNGGAGQNGVIYVWEYS